MLVDDEQHCFPKTWDWRQKHGSKERGCNCLSHINEYSPVLYFPSKVWEIFWSTLSLTSGFYFHKFLVILKHPTVGNSSSPPKNCCPTCGNAAKIPQLSRYDPSWLQSNRLFGTPKPPETNDCFSMFSATTGILIYISCRWTPVISASDFSQSQNKRANSQSWWAPFLIPEDHEND